jgi:hypothetical protein
LRTHKNAYAKDPNLRQQPKFLVKDLHRIEKKKEVLSFIRVSASAMGKRRLLRAVPSGVLSGKRQPLLL